MTSASASPPSRRTLTAIVTCCNSETVVGAMLASIAAQTRPVDQVVVHDAASTDRTLEVVKRWDSILPLSIVASPDRTSVGGSRIRAMKSVTGELIATLDHDDVLMPEHFQVMEALLPRPGIVATPLAMLWTPGQSLIPLREVWPESFPETDRQLERLAWHNFVFGAITMYRSDYEAAGGYPDRSFVEDWELWIKMGLQGVSWAQASVPTFMYRQIATSVSHNKLATREAELELRKRYAAPLRDALGAERYEAGDRSYAQRYLWPDTYADLAVGRWREARARARANWRVDKRLAATAVLPRRVLRKLIRLSE